MDRFKLWYSGGSRDRNEVGILVDEGLRECVVKVRRISNKIMIIEIVIGRLTPQVVLDEDVKKLFWGDLDEVMRRILITEKIFIGEDINGHIGTTSSGFDDVHKDFGFGEGRGVEVGRHS